MSVNQQLISSQSKATNASLLTGGTGSEIEIQQHKERSFFERAFSPMTTGAMRGSIFALLASAMGTGVFNLPYRVGQIGIFSYILFVMISGFFSYVGMYLLSRVIARFKVVSYSDMCEKAYGTYFRKVAEFCLILYAWGITVCYQVIFSKFVMQLLADTFSLDFYQAGDGRQKEIYTDEGKLVSTLVIIGAIVLNLIFILKKEIGILQKTSIIGVFAVLFNVCVITITMFTGFNVPNCKEAQCDYRGITHLDWSKVRIFGVGGLEGFSDQMQGLASLIFCYVNHQLVFPLIYDLKNPTKKRMDKIFFRVHVTQIVSYAIVGMSGYLLLVDHVPERQINAVVLASIVTSPMSLGKLFMVVSLFFAIPLNLFPAREVIYESLQIQKSTRNHIVISLSLAFSGAIIAILFQNVNSYFGLLGGTAGVMMAGGFPALCYFKLKGLRTFNQKMLFMFALGVSVAAAVGAILSVVDPST